MRLLHEIAIFQTVKSKVIISLFKTVKLSVSISLRNLYNSLNSIKENCYTAVSACTSFNDRIISRTGENSIIKARGLSPRTGGQTAA